MQAIRSYISNTYIYITSILLYGFFPFLFFGRKGAIFGCNIWGKNIIGCAKYVMGIKYKIEGEVPKGGVILASMHQSAWETAFFYIPRYDSVFVYKKALAYIPMFNIFLWAAGCICLDRKGGMSAVKKLIRDVKNRTEAGRAVVIFPEGTRKKHGDEIEIKSGILALYKALPEVPIVPVALDSGKLWPRQARIKKAGTITVRFGKPIPSGLSKEEFIEKLKQGMTL